MEVLLIHPSRFRNGRRGVPVVMGGFHATLAPEECGQHAGAVVLGEAEDAWPRLLRDFQAGDMKARCRGGETLRFERSAVATPQLILRDPLI